MTIKACLWQLADEPEYGDYALGYILVSPDGEDELSGPFMTESEALEYARDKGFEIEPLEI